MEHPPTSHATRVPPPHPSSIILPPIHAFAPPPPPPLHPPSHPPTPYILSYPPPFPMYTSPAAPTHPVTASTPSSTVAIVEKDEAVKRRQYQNRISQRAFRKRRDLTLQVLECKGVLLGKVLERLKLRREALVESMVETKRLKQENAKLRGEDVEDVTVVEMRRRVREVVGEDGDLTLDGVMSGELKRALKELEESEAIRLARK